MLLTQETIIAIGEICRLIRLLIEDQPPELRQKSWRRWYKFFDPVFKATGLDDPEPDDLKPTPPPKPPA